MSKLSLWKDTYSCIQHPITIALFLCHLSSVYFIFATTLFSKSLLKSYHDAMLYHEWKSSMDKEMTALHANETWELTSLPPKKYIVGCRWYTLSNFFPMDR